MYAIRSYYGPPSDGTGVCRIDQSSQAVASYENIDAIRAAIRRKYAEVSVSAAGKFQYPTGKAGAIALKYDQEIIRNTSQSLLDSFCGVGNPFSLGNIKSEDVVLDVGCGAGFDIVITSYSIHYTKLYESVCIGNVFF